MKATGSLCEIGGVATMQSAIPASGARTSAIVRPKKSVIVARSVPATTYGSRSPSDTGFQSPGLSLLASEVPTHAPRRKNAKGLTMRTLSVTHRCVRDMPGLFY